MGSFLWSSSDAVYTIHNLKGLSNRYAQESTFSIFKGWIVPVLI